MRVLTLKLSCVRTNSSRSVLGGRLRREQDSWNQPHLYHKSEETLISSFISRVFYMSFNLLAACVSVFSICVYLPASYTTTTSAASPRSVAGRTTQRGRSLCVSELFHGSGAGPEQVADGCGATCTMTELDDHVTVLHLFIY